jgi:hypothetical protein
LGQHRSAFAIAGSQSRSAVFRYQRPWSIDGPQPVPDQFVPEILCKDFLFEKLSGSLTIRMMMSKQPSMVPRMGIGSSGWSAFSYWQDVDVSDLAVVQLRIKNKGKMSSCHHL